MEWGEAEERRVLRSLKGTVLYFLNDETLTTVPLELTRALIKREIVA